MTEPESDFDTETEEEEDRRNEDDDEEDELNRQQRQDEESIYSDDMKAGSLEFVRSPKKSVAGRTSSLRLHRQSGSPANYSQRL